ncbi:hypothetical protein GOODEAATRI_014460, partial [Goodea atripinnis]
LVGWWKSSGVETVNSLLWGLILWSSYWRPCPLPFPCPQIWSQKESTSCLCCFLVCWVGREMDWGFLPVWGCCFILSSRLFAFTRLLNFSCPWLRDASEGLDPSLVPSADDWIWASFLRFSPPSSFCLFKDLSIKLSLFVSCLLSFSLSSWLPLVKEVGDGDSWARCPPLTLSPLWWRGDGCLSCR